MKFLEKYEKLLGVINIKELSEEDIEFIYWVCGWDDDTFYRFKNLVLKIKDSSFVDGMFRALE